MEKVYVGRQFGRLTAVSTTEPEGQLWNCSCSCGNLIQVYASQLLARKKVSCCARKPQNRKDYSGMRFSMLTAIEFVRRENVATIWRFRCTCGNEIERSMSRVKRGEIKSCGCKSNEMASNALTLPDNLSTKNAAYHVHKRSAKTRNYENRLSFEEYCSIALKPCLYCGNTSQRRRAKTPRALDSFKVQFAPINSVDRLNNEPYYDMSNSVPACFECQKAKGKMPAKDFIDTCKRVARKNT